MSGVVNVGGGESRGGECRTIDKINISNFEKRTRNKKLFLTVEREFLILILTRIFKTENSRNALLPGPQNLF